MQDDSRLNLGLEVKRRPTASEKGRPRLALMIIMVLAGVVGWFWLARDPESRERLNQTVESVRTAVADPSGAVSSVVSGVVSGAGELLDSTLGKRQGPITPPPVGQTNGAALPGAPTPMVPSVPTDMATDAENATAPMGSTDLPVSENSALTNSTLSATLPNATLAATGLAATHPALGNATQPVFGASPMGPSSLPFSGTAQSPGHAANTTSATSTTAVPPPSGSTGMSVEDILLRGTPINPEGPLGNGATQRGVLSTPATGTPRDAGRSEDMVVRPAFIDDLAQWMVANYQPSRSQKGKGSLQVSIQAANLRYGAGMRGLYWIGDNLPKGRSEALQYVFTPSMLDALYRLYIDRFMEAMAQAGNRPEGKEKPLSSAQRRDMYAQYASRFQGLAGALSGVASMPDLAARVDAMRKSTQDVINANAYYSDLVFQHDAARESGNNAEAKRLDVEVQAAASVYKETVIKRERHRDIFAKAVGTNRAARTLDNETLVYVGMWINRRVRDNNSRLDAASQAATIFDDLAKRFQRAAGENS